MCGTFEWYKNLKLFSVFQEEDSVNYREINFEEISREAREVDNTGTVSTSSKREGTTSLLPAVAAAGNGDNKKDGENFSFFSFFFFFKDTYILALPS